MFGKYNIFADMLKSYYKAEGNTMVSTFVTDGDYHDLMAGANATLGLFGQSLQLSGGVSYCRQWLTGVNSACHDFVRSSLSASYSLGQFAFFAQFQPRVTELYDSNFSETTGQLVFLASWRHKGLYMELGCRNPFERDYVSHEWFWEANKKILLHYAWLRREPCQRPDGVAPAVLQLRLRPQEGGAHRA